MAEHALDRKSFLATTAAVVAAAALPMRAAAAPAAIVTAAKAPLRLFEVNHYQWVVARSEAAAREAFLAEKREDLDDEDFAELAESVTVRDLGDQPFTMEYGEPDGVPEGLRENATCSACGVTTCACGVEYFSAVTLPASEWAASLTEGEVIYEFQG